jgi:hypothetical protein
MSVKNILIHDILGLDCLSDQEAKYFFRVIIKVF